MAMIETKDIIAMEEGDIKKFLRKAIEKLQEYKEHLKKGETKKAEKALISASEFFGSLGVETNILADIMGKK